jgi:hypothetical protein
LGEGGNLFKIAVFKPGDWERTLRVTARPEGVKSETLASITGRDEFIIVEARPQWLAKNSPLILACSSTRSGRLMSLSTSAKIPRFGSFSPNIASAAALADDSVISCLPDTAYQCPHDAYPGEHRRAVMFGNQQQRLHCGPSIPRPHALPWGAW